MVMRGQKNRIGRLYVYGLLGISTLALLGGCDWFGSSTPADSARIRPGADRQVGASSSLPSANSGRQYDSGIAPVDETRGPQIGSVIATKGGQKAQLDAAAKEAADRDKKAREEREKAEKETADRKAKETPTDAKGSSKPATDEPPTQSSVPAPAPVTTAPVPPPPASPPADQKS